MDYDRGMCPELLLYQKLSEFRFYNPSVKVDIYSPHSCDNSCEMVTVADYRACVHSGHVHLCTEKDCNAKNDEGVCIITGVVYSYNRGAELIEGRPQFQEEIEKDHTRSLVVHKRFTKHNKHAAKKACEKSEDALDDQVSPWYVVSDKELNKELKKPKFLQRQKSHTSESNQMKIRAVFGGLAEKVSLTDKEVKASAEMSQKQFEEWYACYQNECAKKETPQQWNVVYKNYINMGMRTFRSLSEDEKCILADEAKTMWLAFIQVNSTFRGYNEFYHFLVYVSLRSKGVQGYMKPWPMDSLSNCVKQKKDLASLQDFRGADFKNRKMTNHESEFRRRLMIVCKDPVLKRMVNSESKLFPLY